MMSKIFDTQPLNLMDETLDMNEKNQDNNSNVNKKKRLLKKSPHAPKRFRSAYICFVTEKMDIVKSSLPPEMKVTDVMKRLAIMWKALPPLQKKHYESIAEADKNRYFQELSNYNGPMHVPNQRQKKPKGAPKRSMSAFLSYSQLMRPVIRKEFPDLKNTDLSGILAERWRSACEEERRPHLERELREREKYHIEMARWKESEQQRNQEQQQQDEEESKHYQNTLSVLDFMDLPSSFLENENNASHGTNDECHLLSNYGSSESFWARVEEASEHSKGKKNRVLSNNPPAANSPIASNYPQVTAAPLDSLLGKRSISMQQDREKRCVAEKPTVPEVDNRMSAEMSQYYSMLSKALSNPTNNQKAPHCGPKSINQPQNQQQQQFYQYNQQQNKQTNKPLPFSTSDLFWDRVEMTVGGSNNDNVQNNFLVNNFKENL